MPFLQALGYDVFNPAEVIPELTADHGVKKGEKVDYAIKQDGKITILIECKGIGSKLEGKFAGQLYRYFSVTESRFGVLTDGVRYLFFSDLEKENTMDDRPFFEFNLFQFNENHVEELKKFTRSAFDLETIIGTASNLKYHRALISEIGNEFDNPSDDFVRLLASRVYSGRVTQQVRDQFAELCKKAMRDFIREQINDRLKSVLEKEGGDEVTPPEIETKETAATLSTDGIETTKEEWEAYRIIQAIGSELIDPTRIVLRDAKSYCAILFDDNNRRPICRLYFGKKRLAVGIFSQEGEKNIQLEKVASLYLSKNEIRDAIQQYL